MGPVGLSYIQYKNTEIMLFPEMHSYGTDEKQIKKRKLYKPTINIEDITDSIVNNPFYCVDFYHEDIRYRTREFKGGSRYQKYQSDFCLALRFSAIISLMIME